MIAHLANTALPLDRTGLARGDADLDRGKRAVEYRAPVAAYRPRIVLIQGAFDILHVGHIKTFQFARAQGDHLVVALNTNELIRSYKGREPVMAWADKREMIEACRYVDYVLPAPEFSPLALLKEFDIDVYVVAEEWVTSKEAEIAYMKDKGGRVVVSPRFTTFSTTAIKARLLAEAQCKTAEAA